MPLCNKSSAIASASLPTPQKATDAEQVQVRPLAALEAVPQPTIAERMAAAQAAEAERQAAATDEAGRQRCAGARDGCDRQDSDARRRSSPNWCAQPSPKRTPIAPQRAYELTYPCHCVCMSDCRSIHIGTGPGDRGRADGRPRGHRGHGAGRGDGLRLQGRELKLGWRRRLRVRRDPSRVGASHSEAAPPADAPAPSAERL